MGYAILLNFLVYVTLPVPLNFAGILLGIGTFVIYVATVIGLARRELYFWHQVRGISTPLPRYKILPTEILNRNENEIVDAIKIE